MKNIWNWFGALALLILTALVIAAAAHADPKPGAAVTAPPPAAGLSGYLALDAPVFTRPDLTADRSPEFHGYLRLQPTGPVALVVSGDMQLRAGRDFWGENKFAVGLEAPLTSGITPYVTFERRFDVSDNRYFAGVRWNFSH